MARDPESFVNGLVRNVTVRKLQGKPATTRRKLSTVLTQCGWKKRSPERLGELIALLGDHGLFPDPDISDILLPLDTSVRFGTEPPTPLGQTIHPERALGYVLSRYPRHLQEAVSDLGRLKLYSGGAKPEKTFYLDDKAVKPDLVFTSESRRWLVCELETGEPKSESVDQLLRYARAVDNGRRRITALLVTGSPKTRGLRSHIERELEGLRDSGLDARWAIYDVDVVLQLIPG